jgi:hypothetical protein
LTGAGIFAFSLVRSEGHISFMLNFLHSAGLIGIKLGMTSMNLSLLSEPDFGSFEESLYVSDVFVDSLS